MKHSFVVLFLFIYFQTFLSKVFAQNTTMGNVSISSPNAAALGKYVDNKVSYQTGTPQIDIPIYTLKEGPLSIPISVSYHASGLKVLESASSVGAGWSVNAGGMITRTVRGNVDERGQSGGNVQTHGHYSDYGYNKYLFVPGDVSGQLCPFPTPGNFGANDARFADGTKDGEPDLFTFNFSGYSGKFFFNDDRTPVIVPEQDLKIETNLAISPYAILGFTITTPDGTKYFFGQNQTPGNGGVDARDLTGSCEAYEGLSYNTAYSSWYLVKVVSPDNLFSITLKYDEEKYSSYTISMKQLQEFENVKKDYSLVKNYIKGVRLAKISGSLNEINFIPGNLREDLSNYNPAFNSMGDDPNTEAKTLGEIQIQNTAGSGVASCKKFKFAYSYFQDNVTPLPGGLYNPEPTSDRKKLKLESIQEYSCDETKNTPPYIFNYYPEPVSRQLSFAQDHWGFNNGVTTNTNLIPTYTVDTYTYKFGADREAKWPAMRGGTLNKITYPTGGSTDYEFEPHNTWVNATVYNLVDRGYYNGGQGQTNQTIYSNVSLSANHYRITIVNDPCPSGTSCPASVYLEDNIGNYISGPIAVVNGGQTSTGLLVAPAAGTYRIRVSRDNSTAYGNGAIAHFEEIVPSQLQSNVTVGGLRIKKIINHDAVSTASDITTQFTYEQLPGKSSGILYSKPVYVSGIRNEILRLVGYETNVGCSLNGCLVCTPVASLYKTAGSIRPMQTLQGGHIGYNEVKTFQTGKGSSLYRYYGSNIWDLNLSDVCVRNVNTTCDISIPNYPAAPLPFEYMRDELKYESHNIESGSVIKRSWYYPVYALNPLTTLGTMRASLSGVGDIGTLTNYEISTQRKTQTRVEEFITNPITGQDLMNTTTTYYESAFHRQPTRITSVNSKGELMETKYKYAFDFRIPGCDNALSNCLQTYTSASNTAKNTFDYQLATCVSTSSCNCKWLAFQQYRRDISIARNNYVDCQLANKTTYANCFQNNLTAANVDLKPILELQNKNMNPPIEVTSWKNNNLISASLTKYDYSSTVPGNVYPSKVQKINISNLSTNFTNSSVSNSSLLVDSRYENEMNVKYENGNVAEVVGKNGITTSYIWSYNNNLPIVKAVGVSYIVLKNAYDAVSGNLNLIRTQPSLSDAFINTYEYAANVGMTKETDARGKMKLYEYDKMNRLVLVRDQDNNIIKKICYNYAGQVEDCFTNAPCTDTTSNWQNTTTAVRCKTNSTGQYTGEQEQEQKDVNNCSFSYNALRWIVIGTNTSLCPIPSTCNSSICSSQGEGYACINGNCEYGFRVFTSSVYDGFSYSCTYHYEYSNGTWSYDYTTTSQVPCGQSFTTL